MAKASSPHKNAFHFPISRFPFEIYRISETMAYARRNGPVTSRKEL